MSTSNNTPDWSQQLSDAMAADAQLAYDRYIPAAATPTDRPHGVELLVPHINEKGKTVYTVYPCRVVYRGELDGLHLWQAVNDRWMQPGDKLRVAYLPPHSEVTGPPVAAPAVAHG
ncbi:hypothetical protein CH296_18910 [Rhodococcus sp. 14-2496-1d]|uniref:hypothetical protein n=1 Tax=Rhodococcus sp. 14-2496-1d TaxID=2023146 RepID=UPI000B9BE6A7|nr:hypothetical protein [Rhodococcus sp. 14-2496-1d]OZF28481.1 hypothetical protein CH296_18910 [Rhodococcus sp. 14-2496-1d]